MGDEKRQGPWIETDRKRGDSGIRRHTRQRWKLIKSETTERMRGTNDETMPAGDENPQDAGLVSFDTDDNGGAPPPADGENNGGDNGNVVVVPPADDDEDEEDDQPVALIAPNARRLLSRARLLAHLGVACTMALALLVNSHVWNVSTAGMQLPTWDQTGDGWST